MECPLIKRDSVPDPRFNEPKDYQRLDGEGGNYRYYIHSDGFGEYYPCQFCQLIGRKRDIFECFNENEWKDCCHYQSHLWWQKEEQRRALDKADQVC